MSKKSSNFAADLESKVKKMVLAVRFRYIEARTPSFDIVELTFEQWREFFLLERSFMRMEWMIRFLHYEYKANSICELWWIPLDDQDQLKIDNL